MSRKKRQKLLGHQAAAVAWKSLEGHADEWAATILEYMADGKPRTFNRLVLELTDYHHTADNAFKRGPDQAIWLLVQASQIEHTLEAPIQFRLVAGASTEHLAKGQLDLLEAAETPETK